MRHLISISLKLFGNQEKIESFINDIKVGTFKYNPAFSLKYDYDDAFPFDQQFFLILNLAIGGSWGRYDGCR